MSAIFEAWMDVTAEAEVCSEEKPHVSTEEVEVTPSGQFAEKQLMGLIERVFLAGWPSPKHQVVFSGVGEDSGSAAISLRVAETLAAQTRARICLLETEPGIAVWEHDHGGTRADGGIPDAAGAVRASSLQVKQNLWLVPPAVWRSSGTSNALPWVRRKLAEIRGEFDYAVIHAPPAGTSGEAETLARLTDGLVLVLEAHRTRRVLARATQQKLAEAHVQVLGAVLSGRTFPIPEGLYRRV